MHDADYNIHFPAHKNSALVTLHRCFITIPGLSFRLKRARSSDSEAPKAYPCDYMLDEGSDAQVDFYLQT